ncbi:hypothetical protein D3C72_1611350 [compost metagenome]
MVLGDDQYVNDPTLQQCDVGCRLEPDLDVRMLALEALEPGDDPVGQQAGRGADDHVGRCGSAAQLDASLLEHVEGRPDGAQQVLAGGGQPHAPRMPFKQLAAQPGFQLSYLLADRAVRHAQFVSGQRKIQVPGGAVKDTQRVHRGQFSHTDDIRKSNNHKQEIYDLSEEFLSVP